jgi:hypothetical protein
MLYLLAAIAGIIAAVVGWFITGAVTVWVAGLFGMSDFEGGRGMFAFLAVGPIGGLVAMIVAAWLVLRIGNGQTSFGYGVARVAGVLAGIALIVAGGIWLRLATLDTYTDTLPPTLEFEIRLPTAIQPPAATALEVGVHTAKNVDAGTITSDWRSDSAGHYVIGGVVPLSFKTSSRLLVVAMPDQPTRLYRLPLSRDPDSTAALGEWHHADHIDPGREEQPRAAPPDDPVEVRYRVERSDGAD